MVDFAVSLLPRDAKSLRSETTYARLFHEFNSVPYTDNCRNFERHLLILHPRNRQVNLQRTEKGHSKRDKKAAVTLINFLSERRRFGRVRVSCRRSRVTLDFLAADVNDGVTECDSFLAEGRDTLRGWIYPGLKMRSHGGDLRII